MICDLEKIPSHIPEDIKRLLVGMKQRYKEDSSYI